MKAILNKKTGLIVLKLVGALANAGGGLLESIVDKEEQKLEIARVVKAQIAEALSKSSDD